MQSHVHSNYCVLNDVYRNQKLSVNSPVEVRQARGVPETLCERIAVDFQFRNLEEKLFNVPSGNKATDPELLNLPACALSSVLSEDWFGIFSRALTAQIRLSSVHIPYPLC